MSIQGRLTATAGRFLINGAIEHASLDGCRMGSFLDHTLDELGLPLRRRSTRELGPSVPLPAPEVGSLSTN